MAKKMTRKEFHAQRIHIEDEVRTMANRVAAYRDQKISDLFVRSDWSQEEIAAEMKRSQTWVSRRLLFGRFCGFLMTAGMKKLPVDMYERKFRGLWDQHGGRVDANSPGERKKFQAIIDSDDWQLQFAPAPTLDVNTLIKDYMVDNRWRSRDEIVDELGLAGDGRASNAVRLAITRIRGWHAGGLMVMEKTFAGGVTKHKFKTIKTKAGLKTSAVDAVAELAPIVDDMYKCLTQTKLSHDAVGLAKGHLHRLKALVAKYS